MEYHQKLTQWLTTNRYTKVAFAKKLGISRCYFSTICQGKLTPGKFLKEKIDELTDHFGEKNEI